MTKMSESEIQKELDAIERLKKAAVDRESLRKMKIEDVIDKLVREKEEMKQAFDNVLEAQAKELAKQKQTNADLMKKLNDTTAELDLMYNDLDEVELRKKAATYREILRKIEIEEEIVNALDKLARENEEMKQAIIARDKEIADRAKKITGIDKKIADRNRKIAELTKKLNDKK